MHIEEEAITLLNRNGHYDLLYKDNYFNYYWNSIISVENFSKLIYINLIMHNYRYSELLYLFICLVLFYDFNLIYLFILFLSSFCLCYYINKK